jgi:hypothetical protein
MERMLDDLRTDSRWVVLEGPAVTSRPDVSTLAHLADAAVLVAEVPRTRSDQLLDGVEHLGKMGAPVLGVALLPAPMGSGPPLRMASRQASLAADAAPQERRAIPAVSRDDVPVNGDRPAPGHVVADDAPTAPFRN